MHNTLHKYECLPFLLYFGFLAIQPTARYKYATGKLPLIQFDAFIPTIVQEPSRINTNVTCETKTNKNWRSLSLFLFRFTLHALYNKVKGTPDRSATYAVQCECEACYTKC